MIQRQIVNYNLSLGVFFVELKQAIIIPNIC